MKKRSILTAATAAVIVAGSMGAYAVSQSGPVVTEYLCGPDFSTDPVAATNSPNMALVTVLDRGSYTPDPDGLAIGTQTFSVRIDRTLTGSALPARMELVQGADGPGGPVSVPANPRQATFVPGRQFVVGIQSATPESGAALFSLQRPEVSTDEDLASYWANAKAQNAQQGECAPDTEETTGGEES
ncbi:hypothetical protein [Streptomyces sp. NPDC097619]|uniref:hypothetical protein n=1 Tax=Streptomyces sp. NPDC097619 TaxID=3157228 RepID=UPI0033330840